MTSFCPRKHCPTSPSLIWIPAAEKGAQRGTLEGENFPILPPHPSSLPGTRTRKDNKACAQAAPPALPASRPRRPGLAAPPPQSHGAGARAGPPRRGGVGVGTPYLEQHKEPEQRQKAAAAARTRGQVPHRGADRHPGGWRRGRAPQAAAHNGELGLQPQTVDAEAAPGGRMLPFEFPCACPLLLCARGPPGTCQALLFFNS